jgi:hypothetical protein
MHVCLVLIFKLVLLHDGPADVKRLVLEKAEGVGVADIGADASVTRQHSTGTITAWGDLFAIGTRALHQHNLTNFVFMGICNCNSVFTSAICEIVDAVLHLTIYKVLALEFDLGT